jgi:hypothetical protein
VLRSLSSGLTRLRSGRCMIAPPATTRCRQPPVLNLAAIPQLRSPVPTHWCRKAPLLRQVPCCARRTPAEQCGDLLASHQFLGLRLNRFAARSENIAQQLALAHPIVPSSPSEHIVTVPKANLTPGAPFDQRRGEVAVREQRTHLVRGHLQEHLDLERPDEITRPNELAPTHDPTASSVALPNATPLILHQRTTTNATGTQDVRAGTAIRCIHCPAQRHQTV